MPYNRIVHNSSFWDFIEISGHPDLPGQELKAIEKDGVDGVAYKEMQFSAKSTPLYLRGLATDAADLALFIANVKNLQGTQSTIYTSSGIAYNGVVIESVTHNSSKVLHVAQWQATTFTNAWEVKWQMVVRYPYGSF